jgi:hypothetical protein
LPHQREPSANPHVFLLRRTRHASSCHSLVTHLTFDHIRPLPSTTRRVATNLSTLTLSSSHHNNFTTSSIDIRHNGRRQGQEHWRKGHRREGLNRKVSEVAQRKGWLASESACITNISSDGSRPCDGGVQTAGLDRRHALGSIIRTAVCTVTHGRTCRKRNCLREVVSSRRS